VAVKLVVVEASVLADWLERVSHGWDPDDAAEDMASRSSLWVDTGSTIEGESTARVR
jgi:hypothetical protein